jgi:LuxR family transcriptional regulator, maltose regulon positive regulatory protein
MSWLDNNKATESSSGQFKRNSLKIKIRSSLPPPRPNLVIRERLFDKLNSGLLTGQNLTLISAPAGYGKSVLAAEWVRNLQKRYKNLQVLWVSLEQNDNNPEQFIAYLTELLLNKPLDTGLRFTEFIEDDSLPESLTALLDEILIHLFARGKDIETTKDNLDFSDKQILVLEDYHRINSGLIHRSIQYLLDHIHPNLHILLITRVDPPLQLSRLRAHAELTEVRMRDLVFHLHEAAELLNSILEIELNPQWISILTERTEGCAVGLQLAAVSLKQSNDISGFIRDVKGSHRYLVKTDQTTLLLDNSSENVVQLFKQAFHQAYSYILVGIEIVITP